MIIMMNHHTQDDIQKVFERLCMHGLQAHCMKYYEKTIVTAIGDVKACDPELYERMPGVEKVIQIFTPYKLVSREFYKDDSIISIGKVKIGGSGIVAIAGPCAIEGYEQLYDTAKAVKTAGAVLLRGGAYKPRTSPYSFQGLELEGLQILQSVSKESGLPVVSEVTDLRSLDVVCQYVDMLQVGARNMQNFVLLKELGKLRKPILLKRGLAASIEEWLMAAEYIAANGNSQIVLCERGIRTFETYTRNTLDLSAVPLVKQLSHLPVIVDPSHGTGNWRLVSPMGKAAVAAGADGLMIEVHPIPEEALSDGPQSLTPHNFSQLMAEIKKLAEVIGRSIGEF